MPGSGTASSYAGCWSSLPAYLRACLRRLMGRPPCQWAALRAMSLAHFLLIPPYEVEAGSGTCRGAGCSLTTGGHSCSGHGTPCSSHGCTCHDPADDTGDSNSETARWLRAWPLLLGIFVAAVITTHVMRRRQLRRLAAGGVNHGGGGAGTVRVQPPPPRVWVPPQARASSSSSSFPPSSTVVEVARPVATVRGHAAAPVVMAVAVQPHSKGGGRAP
jgi:hypothetical protein